MPFGLIVVLVMHNAELGLILLLFASLGCGLQALEIYSFKSLNLKLIDLREVTHLTAATTVRTSLPSLTITEVISKHGHAVWTDHVAFSSSIYTLEITISWGVLFSWATCHTRSAKVLVNVRCEVILRATHLRMMIITSTIVLVET